MFGCRDDQVASSSGDVLKSKHKKENKQRRSREVAEKKKELCERVRAFFFWFFNPLKHLLAIVKGRN